jgi:uncharacterized protein (TIGR02444 family)
LPRLDPDAFWEFSLAFYSGETVASACLSLQNRRDADVNMLLLCCWLATISGKLEDAGLRAAMAAVSDWRREVLQPLRATRRAVADKFPGLAKADCRAIRRAVLSAELECERIAQNMILSGAQDHAIMAQGDSIPGAASQVAASEMLARYLALAGGAIEPRDEQDLAAIVAPL